MSSAVVSTSAAQGRPFFFDDEAEPEGSCGDSRPRLLALSDVEGSGRAQFDRRSPENHPQSWIPSKILPSTVTPASRLEIRPAPEMVPSGIPAIDALTGGLPRGCLTEICGPASSGRTTFLLAALAAATRRGEFCTVVDASDALDPHSAASAGVALDHLLWVRCGEDPPNSSPKSPRGRIPSQAAFKFAPTESHKSERRLEQVLRATDLLLESGGFGLIVLDLADLPPQAARRIPLTTWFRFRRAIEHTPTILLAIEQHPIAGSCSSLLLQLSVPGTQYPVPSSGETFAHKDADSRRTATRNRSPSHAHLFTELQIHADLIRSRLERKPACSVTFDTKTAWAG